MSRFKFRVWDVKSNKFNWDQNLYIGAQFSHPLLEVYACDNDYLRGEDKFIIQQWTGLQDKNGKDIFEGDIMLWNQVPHLCGDEWDEWERDGKPLQKHIHAISWHKYQFLPFYGYCSHDGEIIGNIFETSHLLNK